MATVKVSELLELSAEERIRLIGILWDSVSELPEALHLKPELREELDRRLEAYYQNPSSVSPWKDVMARVTRSG